MCNLNEFTWYNFLRANYACGWFYPNQAVNKIKQHQPSQINSNLLYKAAKLLFDGQKPEQAKDKRGFKNRILSIARVSMVREKVFKIRTFPFKTFWMVSIQISND